MPDTYGQALLDKIDLDDIAEAYLAARPDDQFEYARLMVRARSIAIGPLLRAIVMVTSRLARRIRAIGRQQGWIAFNTEDIPPLVLTNVLESFFTAANVFVHGLGEAGYVELCTALIDPSGKIRLSAALVLNQQSNTLSNEIQRRVESLIKESLRANTDLILAGLLMLILAKAGEPKHVAHFEELSKAHNRPLDEIYEGIEYHALNALVSSK